MRFAAASLLVVLSIASGAFALSARIFFVDSSYFREVVALERAISFLRSSAAKMDLALNGTAFRSMGEWHDSSWKRADAAARAFLRRAVSLDLEGRRSVALLEGFSRVWGDLRGEIERTRLEISSRYGERLSSVDRRLLFVDLSSSDREALLRERASVEREMASERMRRTVALVEGRLRALEKGVSSISSPFAAVQLAPRGPEAEGLGKVDLSGAAEISRFLLSSLAERAIGQASEVEEAYAGFLSGVVGLVVPSNGDSSGAPLVLLKDERVWYFDESLCVDLTPRLSQIFDGGMEE